MTDKKGTEKPKAPKIVRNLKRGKIDTNLPETAPFTPLDIRSSPSILGPEWHSVFSCKVQFGSTDYEKALAHLIQEPNINSTTIMRTDILSDVFTRPEEIKSLLTTRGIAEPHTDNSHSFSLLKSIEQSSNDIDSNTMPLSLYPDDIAVRQIHVEHFRLERQIVRRIVPRNPKRDPILNQSCLIYTDRVADFGQHQDSILVVYSPHILTSTECPFYLPPARSVGLLYHENSISVHYLLYDDDISKTNGNDHVPFEKRDPAERIIRIAHNLIQTAYKHSCGAKAGYKKRVNHDLIVPKVVFQDKYIELKNKYGKEFVNNWVESTDPKKHVFEDLAIAAFLVELWKPMYASKKDFTFVDVGCGNGLLVNILIREGFNGYGIDARGRKSWDIYTSEVQKCLKEQVIVPKVLLDSEPDKEFAVLPGEAAKYKDLYNDKFVNTADFPENAFLIGNHSDELTVWVPLLDRPFIVIPCCSHALSGAKHRFPPKNPESKSTYASLVDHVEEIADRFGWIVEKEALRIPSTRSTALIGRRKRETVGESVKSIITAEGGADGWVEATMSLRGRNPRNH